MSKQSFEPLNMSSGVTVVSECIQNTKPSSNVCFVSHSLVLKYVFSQFCHQMCVLLVGLVMNVFYVGHLINRRHTQGSF